MKTVLFCFLIFALFISGCAANETAGTDTQT